MWEEAYSRPISGKVTIWLPLFSLVALETGPNSSYFLLSSDQVRVQTGCISVHEYLTRFFVLRLGRISFLLFSL